MIPSDVAGLKAWYDADDITTLFQDSGATTPVAANNDPIGYWGDKSGNANHITQAGAGNRPFYKTAIAPSGNPVVLFDGSDDCLQSVAFGAALAQPNTIYMVIRTLALGSNGVYLDTDASGVNRHQINGVGDIYRLFAGDTTVSSGIAIETASFHILRVLVNGGSSEIEVDGVNTTPGDPGVSPLGGVTIAARFNNVSNINIYAAEILIYNASLSAGDKTGIYDYFTAKWLSTGPSIPVVMHHLRQQGIS